MIVYNEPIIGNSASCFIIISLLGLRGKVFALQIVSMQSLDCLHNLSMLLEETLILVCVSLSGYGFILESRNIDGTMGARVISLVNVVQWQAVRATMWSRIKPRE